MKRSLVFLTLTALLGCPTFLTRAATLASGAEKKQEEISSLTPSGMPVAVASATVTKLNGQSVLVYSVTNQTGENVESVQGALYAFDADGNVRGGAGWIKQVDLTPYETDIFSVAVGNSVPAGSRVVVAVQAATGEDQKWQVGAVELRNAARALARGEQSEPPQARHVSNKAVTYLKRARPSRANFRRNLQRPPVCTLDCSAVSKEAREVCSGGVQSFSCSYGTCSYSSTCK